MSNTIQVLLYKRGFPANQKSKIERRISSTVGPITHGWTPFGSFIAFTTVRESPQTILRIHNWATMICHMCLAFLSMNVEYYWERVFILATFSLFRNVIVFVHLDIDGEHNKARIYGKPFNIAEWGVIWGTVYYLLDIFSWLSLFCSFRFNGILSNFSLIWQYILATSVYPREPEPLKELRKATASHPL